MRVDVHLGPAELDAALRADVVAGLTGTAKQLPPKWFYDEIGCALFEAITRLHEYYPTRREREILVARAPAIAALTGADTLVELGSGTSEKTRLLLSALAATGTLRRFVPFDVSEPTLRAAGAGVANEYPGLEVHAVVGDFESHLPTLPNRGRRLVAFLGGTIGNLLPDQRAQFFKELATTLAPGDALLLGTDLVKDEARLQVAYDDPVGVTAAFNRNVLAVLNRRLGADFVPQRYDHVARWDRDREWIEMHLRSQVEQTAAISALGLEVNFAAGEAVRTEVSAKFRRAGVRAELAAAGLELARWWTDSAGDFALSLSFVS